MRIVKAEPLRLDGNRRRKAENCPQKQNEVLRYNADRRSLPKGQNIALTKATIGCT